MLAPGVGVESAYGMLVNDTEASRSSARFTTTRDTLPS
jgi:hypothetical protein